MNRTRLFATAAALSLVGMTAAIQTTAGAAPASAVDASSAAVSTAPIHSTTGHSTTGQRTSAYLLATPAISGVSAAASDCPYMEVCGWTGDNYTGTMGALLQNNTTLPTIPWHEIDSVYNNGAPCTIYTAGNVWIYRGTDYDSDGGHVAEIHPGTGFPDMQTELPGLWHHVYSNHWCDAG